MKQATNETAEQQEEGVQLTLDEAFKDETEEDIDELKYLCCGKRFDTGNLVQGYYLRYTYPDQEPLCAIVSLDGQFNKICPETLRRCIGLCDKGGTPIFEGNVLKSIWRHLGAADTVTGVVKYIDGAFVLETDSCYLYFEDNIFAMECEIIGNAQNTTDKRGSAK